MSLLAESFVVAGAGAKLETRLGQKYDQSQAFDISC